MSALAPYHWMKLQEQPMHKAASLLYVLLHPPPKVQDLLVQTSRQAALRAEGRAALWEDLRAHQEKELETMGTGKTENHKNQHKCVGQKTESHQP